MKIGYLAAILKRYKYFFLEYVYDIWCRNNLQIPVGNGFLRGVYALTEVRGTLPS